MHFSIKEAKWLNGAKSFAILPFFKFSDPPLAFIVYSKRKRHIVLVSRASILLLFLSPEICIPVFSFPVAGYPVSCYLLFSKSISFTQPSVLQNVIPLLSINHQSQQPDIVQCETCRCLHSEPLYKRHPWRKYPLPNIGLAVSTLKGRQREGSWVHWGGGMRLI